MKIALLFVMYNILHLIQTSLLFVYSYQSHTDRKRKGDPITDRRSQKDPRLHEDTSR